MGSSARRTPKGETGIVAKSNRIAGAPRTSPDPAPRGSGRLVGPRTPSDEATDAAATRPVPAIAARAARLAIAAGMLFTLVLLSLHLLEPEFDPTWRFVSEYALGGFGWLMRLAFCLLAASLLSTGVAIFTQVRTVAGYLGLAVLGLGAVGLVIAAVFITDPIATSQGAATFSGQMHVLGASLDYSPVAFLLLSVALARTPAWRPIRARLFLAAGVTLVIMAAFILLLPRDGRFGPGVFAGLCGRVLLVSYVGWIAVAGRHTLALRRRAT